MKMGEVAEMHIAAYQVGLDPNEMDGADWADFLAEDEPLCKTDADAARMFAWEMNGWICDILASRAKDGESIASRAKDGERWRKHRVRCAASAPAYITRASGRF